MTINVTSTTTGNLITTIPAGALSASGGGTTITNTSRASATLHVGGVLFPSIRKSFSSATIWVGEISRLSIVITNNDPDTTLTQVSLRDELPADVFLANPPSPNLEGCGASASLEAASGGASVTLNNGAIAPGSICTIAVNVTSDVQGRYTNRIADHALQSQQGLTNLSEAVTRLNVQAIGLDKHFSPSTFPAGRTTSLLIILRNPMDSPYTGVSVSDTLPDPLTIVGLTENTCGGSVSTTADTISLRGGTIPAGRPTSPGTCRLSFDVTAPSGTSAGTFRNSIPAGGLTTDQGIGNLSREDAAVTVSSTEVTGIKSFHLRSSKLAATRG